MTNPAVRFAPSPTGLLHVGNARVALANALFARQHGGTFLLRLDDTDAARSRADYAEAIVHDLAWLGIVADRRLVQSERLDRYAAAADRLRAAGRLYPCFESEEELRFKRELRARRGAAPVYDRAMLKLTAAQREAAEAGGKRPYWRFLLSPGTITWDDLVLGRRQVKLPSLSDPVLIRADGTPLYSFTSVVDDIETGITHTIRGEDHVTNTGVQIDLATALGARTQPHFAHLPLLIDADGGKLSKRLDGLSLRGLRQDGMEATALAGFLARIGTPDAPIAGTIDTLCETFDLARFSRSPVRFDTRQLLALNRRTLHELPFDAVQSRLPAGATVAFWEAVRGNLDLLTEARHWWDVVAGDLSPPVLQEDAPFLTQALHTLPPDPWDGQTWSAWIEALRASSGRAGRSLFQPVRLALTGEAHGPELALLLPMMGRARVVARLEAAARLG